MTDCLCLLLLLSATLLVAPVVSRSIETELSSDDTGSISSSIYRALQSAVASFTGSQSTSSSLTRTKRSHILNIENGCVSNLSCIGPSFGTGVPSNLVYCDTDTGLCVCEECFVRLNNTCEVYEPLCRNYSNATNQCIDNRKSQKTAFLLSVFLSSLGAANFYIGNNILGGVQLGILVGAILISVFCLCVPVCVMICLEDYYDDDLDCTCCCGITILISFVVIVLLTVIPFWWVVDLAVFAYNGRTDSNGCPLLLDLY